MDLYYIDGSPFARITRVLARELGLPVTEREVLEFPPVPEFFALNPLGQVPVLVEAGKAYFPTRIIIDVLFSKATATAGPLARAVCRAEHGVEDAQIMAMILAMGDALVAHHYLDWAGVAPVGRNRLGFDPAVRNMLRVSAALDWLEDRMAGDGFQPGLISAQDIALTCFILWAESRGPIEWRGRRRIEAMIARLEQRASFAQTIPQPHALK